MATKTKVAAIKVGNRMFEVANTATFTKGFRKIECKTQAGSASERVLYEIGKKVNLHAVNGKVNPGLTKLKLSSAQASNIMKQLITEQNTVTPEKVQKAIARAEALKAKAMLQGVKF